MPFKTQGNISYPPSADKKLLKPFEKQHREERVRRFKKEHETFISNAKKSAKSAETLLQHLGISHENRGQIEKYLKEISDKRRRSKRPRPSVKALQSHNIARYAPFDFPILHHYWSGACAYNLNGPDARTGAIGAGNATYAGGGITTQSGVGFWYWASRQLTLQVTAQVSAYAQGEVVALFGYVQSYIGLRASIIQWTNPRAQASADMPIYDRSGVITFDMRPGQGGEIFTAPVAMPVLAGNWYYILVESIQRAYSVVGITESTFYGGVGPVIFAEH